jgi:hypothetical protein
MASRSDAGTRDNFLQPFEHFWWHSHSWLCVPAYRIKLAQA